MLKNEFILYIEALHQKRRDFIAVAKKYGADNPEDVVQDAFIKLLEWRQRNEEGKYNEGLFFFIVRNTALDEARKAKLTTELTGIEIIEAECQTHTDAEVTAIHATISSFQWFDAKLLDVYFDLSRTQPEQMTMRELSAQTGISISTIYTTIKRCKERIREAIHVARV